MSISWCPFLWVFKDNGHDFGWQRHSAPILLSDTSARLWKIWNLLGQRRPNVYAQRVSLWQLDLGRVTKLTSWVYVDHLGLERGTWNFGCWVIHAHWNLGGSWGSVCCNTGKKIRTWHYVRRPSPCGDSDVAETVTFWEWKGRIRGGHFQFPSTKLCKFTFSYKGAPYLTTAVKNGRQIMKHST